MSDELARVAIFQQKEIRKQLHGGEWWFVITDVIAALTDSENPSQYLRNLRNRDEELLALFEPVEKGAVQIVPPLYYSSIHLEESKSCLHGTQRVSSVSFSQSRAKKPSRSSAGSQKWDMSEKWRK